MDKFFTIVKKCHTTNYVRVKLRTLVEDVCNSGWGKMCIRSLYVAAERDQPTRDEHTRKQSLRVKLGTIKKSLFAVLP